jgi:hypothetical protein
MWHSSQHEAEVLLFLSPCFIFAITTAIYYRFIITYTGDIAGWSVAGLFGALFCCVKLLEAEPGNWAAHLKWVYVLFLSYVLWDVVMLLFFLPKATDAKLAKRDEKEIRILSFTINQPTLLAVLMMWLLAHHFASDHVDSAAIANYVDGVVAFHLMFASAVAVISMFAVRWADESPAELIVQAIAAGAGASAGSEPQKTVGQTESSPDKIIH